MIGQGVPAAEVVIDAHAGVPLGDVVDLAVLGGAPGGAATPNAGDGVVVLDVDAERGVRLERRGEADLHAGVVDEVVGFDEFAVAAAVPELDRFEDDAFGGVVGTGGARGSRAVWPGRGGRPEPALPRFASGSLCGRCSARGGSRGCEGVGRVVGVGDDLVVGENLGGGVELACIIVVGLDSASTAGRGHRSRSGRS